MSTPSQSNAILSPTPAAPCRGHPDAHILQRVEARRGAVVNVLCVDDHAVLVEGLKVLFDADAHVRIVGQLPSGEQLLEEVDRIHPDVVLLDIEMPGPDVFELADRLRHLNPSVRILFLSAHVRDGYLAAAYKCGASGYFAKGDDLNDIVRGILEAARSESGTFVMGAKVRERCVASGLSANGRPNTAHHARPHAEVQFKTPLESLSAREIEVLRLIGKGLSRTEIAGELSRSAKTIDGHQERMMKKLRIQSRSELMRFAIREGLAQA